MKTAIVTLVLLATVLTVSAQATLTEGEGRKEPRMALEFAAGYSMPLSSHVNFTENNKVTGNATPGFVVQAGFSWLGSHSLGLGAQYTFQKNGLKNTADLRYPNGRPDSVDAGSWTCHSLMIGPVFMKNFGKLHFDVKLLGGFALSFSSNYQTPDPRDTTGVGFQENMATGFGINLSAGVGYMLTPHLALKANVGLLALWPTGRRQYHPELLYYKKVFDPKTGLYNDEPVYSAPVDYEIKSALTTLNPAIGLVYRF